MKIVLLLAAFIYLAAASPLQNDSTLHCTGECQQGAEAPLMNRVMRLKLKEHEECVREHHCPTIAPALSNLQCVNGKAGEYECNNVDLLAYVPLRDMGSSGDGNDIWGWTSKNGREFAIVGCADGTSFVEITDPTKPEVMGFMKTHTVPSLWRDIKVYKDHAFVVSEASGHGMQVYDLTQLEALSPGPNEIKPDAHYAEMGSTHNIVGNEESGFMYAVGTKTCRGGLHMIDVRDPKNPKYAGCFADDGYVHDAQCVNYEGPDTDYTGREICFCYNEDTLTIVDVTDKTTPKMLSTVGYDKSFYTHQGWLNEEQSHLLMNDELDEIYGTMKNTRSMIWSVEDLDKPELVGSFRSEKTAVDHNLYIRGKLAYESNYSAGLRILNIENMAKGDIKEVGYFDVSPDFSGTTFNGAWSAYVYFESGNIIVNSIERGLFVLKYTGPEAVSS